MVGAEDGGSVLRALGRTGDLASIGYDACVGCPFPPLAPPMLTRIFLLLTPTANPVQRRSQPPEKREGGSGHGPTLADQIEHM